MQSEILSVTESERTAPHECRLGCGQTVEALRDVAERFRVMAEATFEAIVITENGRVIDANPQFAAMFGYAQSEVIGMCPADFAAPEDRERVRQNYLASVIQTYEGTSLRRDGTTFPAEFRGRPITYLGRSARATAICDITERQQAGEALRASEGRYRGLMEFSPEAIIVCSESRFVYVNAAAAVLFGAARPEDLLGRPVLNLVHPDFHALAHERTRRSQQEGLPSPLTEQKYVRLDGTVIDVESVITPVVWEGRPAGQVLIRDITERKRSDEALRLAQAELEARVSMRTTELAKANKALQDEVIERQWTEVELQKVLAQSEQMLTAITSILIGVDQDGCITIWNAAARRAFGPERDDVQGRPFAECGVQWDWDKVLRAVAECEAAQKPVRGDDIRYLRDGKERFLGITVNPVSGYSDVPMGFLLLAADITERKLLESHLAQSQKLESIGQLAAGIAHELNTPIQYVGDNTRFLRDSFADLRDLLDAYGALTDAARSGIVPPDLVEQVEAAAEGADLEYLRGEIPNAIAQSLDGIERVAAIVRAMKDFSHPGTTHKANVDLNRAIESTATVARSEWKYVADLVMQFDPALPPVPCLPSELNQVFLNIIVNAAHAIGDAVGDGTGGKGTITLSTRADPACGPTHAEVRISDTGTGILPEIRSKIFDPFFTTKGVGRGTGQGLAIAHGIVVEKHGGTIICESVVGQGTTFVIRLPLHGGKAAT